MARSERRTKAVEATEIVEVSEQPEAVVTFPVGEIPDGVYLTAHIDVQLDGEQRAAMRRLLEGFSDRPQRLANGRFIQNGADVVRYLCEQVAEAVE